MNEESKKKGKAEVKVKEARRREKVKREYKKIQLRFLQVSPCIFIFLHTEKRPTTTELFPFHTWLSGTFSLVLGSGYACFD